MCAGIPLLGNMFYISNFQVYVLSALIYFCLCIYIYFFFIIHFPFLFFETKLGTQCVKQCKKTYPNINKTYFRTRLHISLIFVKTLL